MPLVQSFIIMAVLVCIIALFLMLSWYILVPLLFFWLFVSWIKWIRAWIIAYRFRHATNGCEINRMEEDISVNDTIIDVDYTEIKN